MNHIDVQLEPSDYLAAQRLHTRWTWSRLAIHAAVIVAGSILLFFATSGTRWLIPLGAAMIGGAAAGLAVREVMRRVFLPYRSRKLFAQHKALHPPMTLEWDREALQVHAETGNSRTPWRDYLGRREDRSVILLYVSEALFLMVPLRGFVDAAQEQSFRECLAAVSER
jgi:hypothetical protein